MKNKQKLSIVISSYDDLNNPVYSGGGAYAVHQVAKRLAKKNNITVLTGTYKNAENKIIDNVRYIRIGSDILGHKIGQLIYQYSMLKYAIKNNYDVWIESTTPPFTFSLLPMFAKKPVISWVHMICSFDMQRKYKINFRAIEQELCRLYSYIIVPTGWAKKEVITMNKKAKIFTITPGFEQKTPQKPLKKLSGLGKYLLYVGRIEVNQKGLDLLFQALQFTGKKTQVAIAGSGSEKEHKKMNKLIAEYGIENKIKKIGKVNSSKKEALFKYAKAVIIPSRFETFSLTALESILHQKPIICFAIPQLNWIPVKYAYKITPFKIDKLAHCIDRLLTTGSDKAISNHDKKIYLKNNTWKNTASNFDDLISKIIL